MPCAGISVSTMVETRWPGWQNLLLKAAVMPPLHKTLRQPLAIWWAGAQNWKLRSTPGFPSPAISQGYKAGIMSYGGWAQCCQSCKSSDCSGRNVLASRASQEALAPGADAGPLCCEEVAPTAPPNPVVCGFSGLLAARGGNARAAHPASPGLADLVLRCEQSVCAPGSTLGAGP